MFGINFQKALLSVCFLLTSIPFLAAQQLSTLIGKVIDTTLKEPLIFANIALMQGESIIRTSQSDMDGMYQIDNIPIGKYNLKITYVGLRPHSQDIEIKQDTQTLDIYLDGGTAAEAIIPCEVTSAYNQSRDYSVGNTNSSPFSYRDNYTMASPRTKVKKTKPLIKGKVLVQKPAQDKKVPNLEEEVSLPASPNFVENQPQIIRKNPTSTFSIDVDRASYTLVRKSIEEGDRLPEPASVRIEEMINYFKYDFPPVSAQHPHPYNIYTELSDCPWNTNAKLLMLNLQAKNTPTNPKKEAMPNNLVFLLDVSGSMSDDLILVKESLKLLINKMRPQDYMSLVVYAGAAGLVLPPTSGADKNALYEALNNLEAGGSTAGGEGILLAYETAQKHFLKKGNNRIILCTDGDFNVGINSETELEQLVEQKRKSGVYLTVLGFGDGNYQDKKMEILADKGNGNYSYIDNLGEANKTLVKEMNATLQTVAKDVKFQLHFNPKVVATCRLVGYENRVLENKDFENDNKDAGEMGEGHTVTAFYELQLVENADTNAELVKVRTRYKLPKKIRSTLYEIPVLANTYRPFAQSSENFRFAAAVAGFGMCLRESEFKAPAFDLKKVIAIAETANETDPEGYKDNFIELVEDALP